jgi:sugar phosphate permease
MKNVSNKPVEEGFRKRSIGLISYLFVIMYLNISLGGPESMNLILPTLEKTFGWAPPEVAVKIGIVRLLAIVSMFIIGTLYLKVGIKKIFIPCGIIGGLLVIVMGNVQTLNQFVWIQIALGVFGPAYQIALGALTAKWFVRTRGRVLGIITIAFPLSTATFTLIGTKSIAAYGYQGFYTAVGIIITIVSAAGIWLVADSPESVGLSPDGIPFTEKEKAEIEEKKSHQSAWDIWRILKTPQLWAYTIAWCLIGLVLGAIMSQMIPVFTSAGIGINSALLMMSVAALAGMPLSYVWGILDDKFGTPKTCAIFTCVMVLGALGMAYGSAESTSPFYLAVLCIALGTAGMPNLAPSLLAYMVGREEFININRYVQIVNSLFISISMAYVPVMHGIFGSYKPVFLSLLVFPVIILILLIFTQKSFDPERLEMIEKGKIH